MTIKGNLKGGLSYSHGVALSGAPMNGSGERALKKLVVSVNIRNIPAC